MNISAPSELNADAVAPEAILQRVTAALDVLIACGEPYGGLFPSLIDRRERQMLTALPPTIAGQRIGDRAFLGSNLIHDEPTLHTLCGLGAALGRPDYTEAADAYLKRFATHCTGTVTGLFPWGEHSFWQLVEDRPGDGSHNVNPGHRGSPTHDHLRQAPVWLWDKLQTFNPLCVQRFAEGLEFHWVEDGRHEYNRHATLQTATYWPRHERACDFPRHGGFYILDWAFAWLKSDRHDFLRQIDDMLGYWWRKRDADGLLPLTSREVGTPLVGAPSQTLSLGVSLLEAAELLAAREPARAATMRARGGVYIAGFLAAPHDLEHEVFVSLIDGATGAAKEAMPVWGSRYGVWPAAYTALTALRGHALGGNAGLLAWAEAVGRAYAAAEFPVGVTVPAMDAGLALGLFAELYATTRQEAWLAHGQRLATTLLPVYFDDEALPRGAAGVDWYESQMGPGFLLHGLARLALLTRDGPAACVLDGDFTAR